MNKIEATLVEGYGAASGKNKDSRYPQGTIQAQLPFFKERGLDLSHLFLGTLNLDISPFSYQILQPKHFIEQLNWSTYIPPENFYFFDLTLRWRGNEARGMIYLPDPSTKQDHFQKDTMVEALMPWMEEVPYGSRLMLETNPDQLIFVRK